MIRDMIAQGYEVHATAPDMGGQALEFLESVGAVPHSLPLSRSGLNPLADLRYLREMRALIRRIGPDLVINYTIKPNIWGSIAARMAGVPACSMVTGIGYMMIEAAGMKQRAVQAIATRLYAAALAKNPVVIFQNNDDVEDFVKAGIIDRGQARTVRGSGVNLEQFAPVPLPSAPVFVMVARLLRSKGVLVYAEAAREVRRQYPQARFLLVGMTDPGPDGVSSSDVGDWSDYGVEYLGPKADVRPSIAESSVFVLPSYYREGTPRSVLEAMAMGRAIITTDAPGCRETVRQGENGYLIPVRDVGALRDAMIRLVENETERAAMGQASLAMAREIFDVHKVNRELFRHLGIGKAQG
ncbi:MAG: glycosyltransferase family 4 protein [Sphingopyxis sp.]|nr:glycosyltransferase family 4 protein [Sphingopyxis sp.]